MSTVLRKQPVTDERNGEASRARLAAVTPAKKPTSRLRRRWGRLAAGITIAILGAWIAAALYLSAGDRTEVLVLANKVDRFAAIQRSDLRTVRISTGTDTASIDAKQLDSIIGRVASTDLVSGSILADEQLLPSGQKLLTADEAIVGLLLTAGDSQMKLRHGAPILVVVRPAAGQTTAPVEVKGWVFDSSTEALSSRERPIELAIPRASAALVSAAAADKRVTVVALGE
jgi:hypothetical protein